LLAAAEDARRPSSYARTFEKTLKTQAIDREVMAAYERDLEGLDAAFWSVLKAAAVKRLLRNKQRSWQPLFDMLSEAKAYAYLASLGCTAIQMIPPTYDAKTPDLRAELNGGLVLCEVKTITMSDETRTTPDETSASQPRRRLTEEFLTGKLTWTLRAAKAQLEAFPSPAARKLTYLVFIPDESWNDYADDYGPQVRTFLKDFPLGGVEVEIFQFPRIQSPAP
jgi:hypothetical protein